MMRKQGRKSKFSKPDSKTPVTNKLQIGTRGAAKVGKKSVSPGKKKRNIDADSDRNLEASPNILQNKASNKTSSLEEMAKHYKDEFLNNPKYSYITMDIRDPPNIPMLKELYKKVTESGGFKEVTASCKWNSIYREIKNYKGGNIFELYK